MTRSIQTPITVVDRTPNDAEDAIPLIVVHGTGGDARDEIARLAPLAVALDPRVRVLAPQFETPYQFLLPDADLALLRALGEMGVSGPLRMYGMSGGAQFVHRFAHRHPHRVEAAAVLAAGLWTRPNGTPHGMMIDDGWFARPEWSDPELQRAAGEPAADGWQRIRWLVGCGLDDLPARLRSARRQHATLQAGGADAVWLEWPGGHESPPTPVLRQLLHFLLENPA